MRSFWLAACSLIITLLLLEGMARLFGDRLEARSSRVVPVEITRYDSNLGWSHIPGAVAVSTATGEPVTYRINSRGLRGGPVGARAARAHRILLTGDSRAFGFGVSEADHVPALLEGYLDDTEVLNAGVAGYGIDQILLQYETVGAGLDADLVILYLPHFGSHRHMHGIRFGKRKPQFRIGEDGLRRIDDLPDREMRDEPLWPVPWTAMLQRHSVLLELVIHRLTKWMSVLEDPWVPPVTAAEAREQDRLDGRDGAFRARMLALAVSLTERMARDVEAGGAVLLVATEMKAFADALDAQGIEALHVYHALDNPAYEHAYSLEHLNGMGNAVLASVLHARILERRWLCDGKPAHNLCPGG